MALLCSGTCEQSLFLGAQGFMSLLFLCSRGRHCHGAGRTRAGCSSTGCSPLTTETALDFAFLSLDLNETSGEAGLVPEGVCFIPNAWFPSNMSAAMQRNSRDVMTNIPKKILFVSGRGSCDTADALGSLQQSHKHWLIEPTKPQQLLLRRLGLVTCSASPARLCDTLGTIHGRLL